MRYNNKQIIKTTQGKPYYKGKQYPNIPLSESDIYVITTIGDRLDLLSYQYYKDVNYWWVISVANNNVTRGSLFPTPGTQLRIPMNLSNVIDLYNKFNEVR